jgi:hypothetical protein
MELRMELVMVQFRGQRGSGRAGGGVGEGIRNNNLLEHIVATSLDLDLGPASWAWACGAGSCRAGAASDAGATRASS